MDLSTLSVAELRELQQRIPAEIKKREQQEKANILSEVKAFAKARGYNLDDLVAREARQPAASGGKVKVKYRHPQQPELQWTGRGRTPKWVSAWTDGGGSLDALKV